MMQNLKILQPLRRSRKYLKYHLKTQDFLQNQSKKFYLILIVEDTVCMHSYAFLRSPIKTVISAPAAASRAF